MSKQQSRPTDGICKSCGAPAVPHGNFCPACYGGVLHPEGLPMTAGDHADPCRALNAQSDAWIMDGRMPKPEHVGAMSEPTITPEDEARYMQIMADYDVLMRVTSNEPVPMCHFTPMEFHECDSDPSGRNDGYECRHCGHTESSEEAWAKVESRKQHQAAAVTH